MSCAAMGAEFIPKDNWVEISFIIFNHLSVATNESTEVNLNMPTNVYLQAVCTVHSIWVTEFLSHELHVQFSHVVFYTTTDSIYVPRV